MGRERLIVFAGIAGLSALAWAYLAASGMAMMPMAPRWGTAFGLWSVMMVAMMLPSVAPALALFAEIERGLPVRVVVFLGGYLTLWLGFSAVAVLIQQSLPPLALRFALPEADVSIAGALLLIAAGLFQWTPLKHACLTHCRSPQSFFMTEWRAGAIGAFRMGLRHGLYCLGCCWLIMSLLFLVGAMNLLWMAAIAAFVLVEKALPAGDWLGRVGGVGMAGWGAWLIVKVIA